jgi:aminoglycoside phosphotransferase (APT) family kinase protein
MTPPRRSEDLTAALVSVLVPVLGEDVDIAELRPMPGGSSRETWSFRARTAGGGDRRLVLRRDPPGVPSAGLALEAGLLAEAAAAGVPVPELVATGAAQGSLGGAFVVMAHVEGETLPRRVLRQCAERNTGDALAAQCGRVLASIHAIPPASLPGLPGGDPLEQLRGVLDHVGEPHPALELGLRRLAAVRPPRSAEVVVHGDFRNGNLIVGEDGIGAVLDWELAHRGDPLEDLGWLCAKAWRFGSPLPVGGFGSLEPLLDAYQEAGGLPVDRSALTWWEALSALRWGVICIVQAQTHLSGARRSVELAAIGRRTCEAEWDLLELLQATAGESAVPGGGTQLATDAATSASAPAGEPHDRPTCDELLQAVEDFVRQEVLPAHEGRSAFHLRVAANALAIVRRQLALGPGQRDAHRARLAALGMATDGELAAAIRSGAFDERLVEVLAAVRHSVADKLAVANPTYVQRA